MTLAVERVLQDPAHLSAANNCYFHDSAVCCMLDGRYRWMRWEGKKPNTSADLDESQVRMFGSGDQGATWALLTEFDLPPVTTQWHHIFSTGGNRLLAGIFDPLDSAYNASYSLLPRSEDGGVTWTSAVSSAFYSSLSFQALTQRFVKLPGTTTVLAFGQYEVGGLPFNVLRSTDDGLTFTAFANVGVFLIQHAAALTATTVVCTDGTNGFVSTDGGATWSAATKPSISDVLGVPISMGSGVVLTCGRSSALGAIFRSVDSGQNYSLLAMLPGASNVATRGLTLQAVTTTTLLAGGNTTADLQSWWLSEDAGATWEAAISIVGDRAVASDSASMTITTQGFMLAALDRPTRATVFSDNIGEIWRGTVAGFVSTGIGTCEALLGANPEPPLAAALLGTHLLCIPILSPAPCPPVCPADPVQPEGVLVIPDAPGVVGGGFRSVLYFLGLVEGAAVVAPPIGVLGRPATCGATFANNYCAVAGC